LVSSFGAKLLFSEESTLSTEALNSAAHSALGEFLVFLGQNDFLEEGWWRPLLVVMEDADCVYTDSFKVDSRGHPIRVLRKPGWSPTRLIFEMYAKDFFAIRKNVFEKVGGFHSKFFGEELHELALRVSEITNRFQHIEIPLYNSREKPESEELLTSDGASHLKALTRSGRQHLDKMVSVADLGKANQSRSLGSARFSARQHPVSVVIPTAFSSDASGIMWAERLLNSLLPFLRPDLGDEVILVHGGEPDSGLLARSRAKSIVSIFGVSDFYDFSFSRRCNIGFEVSRNEHILLLNDDIEFGEGDPFDSLFGILALPNVALVGALLTFPDYSVQHGGQMFIGGLPYHVAYAAKDLNIEARELEIDREVVGVTGAFMFQLRSTWRAVGGFTLALPLSYNDVDYCQKIRSLGFNIIQANSVSAIHYESVTRIPIAEHWEKDFIKRRWSDAMASDKFTHPYQ
jgi:GT2 family glycosyltransferase